MCKALKINTNGYYNWLKSKVSKLWLYNQKLSELIATIFNDSFKRYGTPRIKMALEKLGHYISRPRVVRIMQANSLFARRKPKPQIVIIKTPIAANILNQNFKVSQRIQK